MLEKEKKRRRLNRWYGRWLKLSKLVKKNEKKELLFEMFKLVNQVNGHHYAWIAQSSFVDLNLVIEDCFNKNCEECENRFECFTEK